MGFGREETEATHICLKNFIDAMLEQSDKFNETQAFLRMALKELKDPTYESNNNMSFNMSFDNQEIEALSNKIGNNIRPLSIKEIYP